MCTFKLGDGGLVWYTVHHPSRLANRTGTPQIRQRSRSEGVGGTLWAEDEERDAGGALGLGHVSALQGRGPRIGPLLKAGMARDNIDSPWRLII